MSGRLYLVGQVFGRLTVIKSAGSDKNKQALWLCRCECGNEITQSSNCLRRGNTRSCGCLRRELVAAKNREGRIENNPRATIEFKCWCGLVERCTDPNSRHWPSYGGRGIGVCQRWKDSFEHFLLDMGKRPQGRYKYSIDRIDNNGDYCPENCRWATYKQQARNRRNSRLITFNGETLTVAAWAEKIGIGYQVLGYRLEKWSIERALTEPLHIRP